MLAREPYRDPHFEAYIVRGFPQRVWHGDYHSGKGFCALRFATPDGDLTLIDTHLHAQYGDDAYNDEYPHRVAQVVQIAAAIAATRTPVLAAGDFNFSEGRHEYEIFTGLTGVRDGAAELDRRQPTTLGANPYRNERPPHDDERIDYVFTRDCEGARLRVRRIDRIFDDEPPAGGPAAYSDHAGLVAEVELARDPGARPPEPDAAAAELAARELAAGRAAALARRGERRLLSAGALGGAALALAGRRRPRLSRRRLLRAGLAAGALIALPVRARATRRSPSWRSPTRCATTRRWRSCCRCFRAASSRGHADPRGRPSPRRGRRDAPARAGGRGRSRRPARRSRRGSCA